ncbi:MAG: helix-turn-helix domain-containing protein [Ruminococcus sp.]|nr:helix-turn-helix domain-containing protein [Ruminococcus sp.]
MGIQFNQLKMFRKQSGLTQEEVAEKLGVSRQAVAKWEHGDSLPDIECCIALADLYGTTIDKLVRDMSKEAHTGDGKHIFGIVKMNDKGQITLPAGCRKVFGLESGDTLLILGDEEKGGIAIVKI